MHVFPLFTVMLIAAQGTLGEMFTSVADAQRSVAVEMELLGYLEEYLERETLRLNDLRRFFKKVKGQHSDIYQGQMSAMANPLVAYSLIKRLQSEWLNVVYSTEANENIQDFKASYEKEDHNLPKFEDLQGAAQALMRLQDVYALSVNGLANGRFQRFSFSEAVDIIKLNVSTSLSADDCYHVGKVAYEMEDYYHAILWLEEAAQLFREAPGTWNTEDEGSLESVLDYLAFSYFKMGDISKAINLSQELLAHDPSNKRVSRNIKKYQRLLASSTATSPNVILQRPNSTYLQTRTKYEWLCQTLGSQPTHYKDPRLYCDFYTGKNQMLLFKPMKREIFSLEPYVVLYHSFISDSEADKIKELAAPGLHRSIVASGEKQSPAHYRISKSAWLKDTSHTVVSNVDKRIAALSSLNVQPPYAEYLQVVNYGIGGHYEPHFDHATSTSSPVYKLNTGNRVATFMIYLSSVEAGGSTAFIYANFSVPVVKNAALFWWNLHKNGQGNGDTLHAGCPVLVGDKWGTF
ncbi:prolyl 4-hydroxylase subunit alpha-3 [Polypterus senegalus]|uniref:prolyl 4-hydroxylase subunit alpha-3 n=1 Tax=Polypterus senegalus TaxID=55291 RepID=UPI0019669461|nr:prolyl 4-hydroxylase subunit alpha-3 [Polypterus senegalus]